MDTGAWWATVHGVKKELDKTEQTYKYICVYIYIEHTQTCLTYIEYILSVLYVQIYRDLDNLNSVYSFLWLHFKIMIKYT